VGGNVSEIAGGLYRRSVDVILAHQGAAGGYVAAPTFAQYRYCWFRDGAFIAHAMDLAGERASARRFHDWCANVVTGRRVAVERAVVRARQGKPPAGADVLHARYTLEGEEGDGEGWPNFQLDGLGTWLWALGEHVRLGEAGAGSLSPAWREAALLVARYLGALWKHPCYDCWEESGDRVHVYTLAAICGGLEALVSLGLGGEWEAAPAAIRAFVLEQGVCDGRLTKSIGNSAVDAGLVGAATPYRLFEPDDPIVRATIAAIEAELRREGGGVHRYGADTYYGGGEWVLLTAWLGWHYAGLGERGRARDLLAWIEAQADEEGNLPEQVPRTLTDPACLATWRERWGEIARPLLWSHAKYVTLCQELAGWS
jgi:GH15 family glucan-1,4-alpha-glucosidase